jgi:hypothetical protein
VESHDAQAVVGLIFAPGVARGWGLLRVWVGCAPPGLKAAVRLRAVLLIEAAHTAELAERWQVAVREPADAVPPAAKAGMEALAVA